MFSQGTKSRGAALISIMIIAAIFLMIGAAFSGYVLNERHMVELFIQNENSFYMAEAGIEEAKSIIAENPYWFTDAAHTPNDDAKWLLGGAKGVVHQLDSGSYKIVRESGKKTIYSVGYIKEGRTILRVKYYTNPFRVYEFKII
jgi:Tfp pilus assembly protein PilX